MHSLLSYFSDYFSPNGGARPELHCHSAAWIARNLFAVLSEFGSVDYIDCQDQPEGRHADLFIGHFWSFARQAQANHFRHKLAFYSIANPDWTHRQLHPLSEQYQVPFPHWDFPPSGFCNRTTLSTADGILLVGNSATVATFPEAIQGRIQPLNYSVDPAHFYPDNNPEQLFCYVATQCDLRKGFMDVLKTWQALGADFAPIQLIGSMRAPWREQFNRYNPGNMNDIGWLDSTDAAYSETLRNHRFAYIPTYSEGQMGTVLEAIFSGCIPITTRMSGIDDRVLEHCLLVEPRAIDQHVLVMREAAKWPYFRWRKQRDALLKAAQSYQSENSFRNSIRQAVTRSLEKQPQQCAL